MVKVVEGVVGPGCRGGVMFQVGSSDCSAPCNVLLLLPPALSTCGVN